jgi:hypothetical protein
LPNVDILIRRSGEYKRKLLATRVRKKLFANDVYLTDVSLFFKEQKRQK